MRSAASCCSLPLSTARATGCRACWPVPTRTTRVASRRTPTTSRCFPTGWSSGAQPGDGAATARFEELFREGGADLVHVGESSSWPLGGLCDCRCNGWPRERMRSVRVFDARKAANQRNLTRSTGPKSREGKEISRGNSRKHGLAGDLLSDGVWALEVERVARVFGCQAAETRGGRGAREMIARVTDLMRVGSVRLEMWSLAEAKADLAAGDSRAVSDCEQPSENSLQRVQVAPGGEIAALLAVLPRLLQLERYERRAHARWRRMVASLLGENL